MYDNPEIFDPERFIPRDGKDTQPDPYDFCFGFGRRICPGAPRNATVVERASDYFISPRHSLDGRTDVYIHGFYTLRVQYRERC